MTRARIAIVHDYLAQYGGAERVVEALHELWPEAPIFTTVYDRDGMPASFRRMDVRTSFLQSVPVIQRRSKLGLPLYPAAIASLDVRGFDVVVSSSSGWAHGVVADADAHHVVYCHNPARWLYRAESYDLHERVLAAPFAAGLRRWDRRAALRPTEYLANSQTTRERIFRCYGRAAEVVHPPVETSRFSASSTHDDYYLCAARLTSYKRIELAISACDRAGAKLVVAGDGPARDALERAALGTDTEFIGRISDRRLAGLMQRCRALIVPAEEDFCITAVEAMAAGRPVVGFARGGLLETVVNDKTGVLFAHQTPESVAGAITHLERLELDPQAIRRHALRFDVRRFQQKMHAIVAGDVAAAAPALAAAR